MFETRDQKVEKGRQLCVAAIKAVEQAAREANMEVKEWKHEHGWLNPGTTVNSVGVMSPWKLNAGRLVVRIQIGEYGEKRSYPVKEDGSFNVRAVLDRVKAVQQLRKDKARRDRAQELQEKEDDKLYERLSALHAQVGRLHVECKSGRASVRATGLDEDEAKRVLAALADVLRPTPAIGEIWQHRKVQMPSRITSVKGMIKLEGVEKGQTCAIPKREFLDGWELVSASPEGP